MVGRFLRGVRLAVVDALLFIWLVMRLVGNQTAADCPGNGTRMDADGRGLGEGCGLLSVPYVPYVPLPYGELITQTAQRHGLDPALLAGLVQVESNFDPRAVSNAGAMGLTQIMPGTAEELGLERPFDVAENLDAGARYLAWLIDYFEGDVERALMAYHGGPGRVAAGGERPIDVQYARDVLEAGEVISGQFSVPSGQYSVSTVQLPYVVGERVTMTQGWHGLAGWEGVDYSAGCGAVLVAPIAGEVVYNGRDGYIGPHSQNGEQSSMLVIRNGRLAVTLFHGEYSRVQVGQWVRQGQVVGFEDKIGNATGCHTHLTVQVDGQAVGVGAP